MAIWSNLPCSSRVIHSQLPKTMPIWVLNAFRDGDFTTSLASCASALLPAHRKIFLMFRRHLLCASVYPLPLAQSLGTTEKSLALPSLYPPFRYLWASMQCPKPPLLQAEQSQLSLPLLTGEVPQSLEHLGGPTLYSFWCVHVSFCSGAHNCTQYSRFGLTNAKQRENLK